MWGDLVVRASGGGCKIRLPKCGGHCHWKVVSELLPLKSLLLALKYYFEHKSGYSEAHTPASLLICTSAWGSLSCKLLSTSSVVETLHRITSELPFMQQVFGIRASLISSKSNLVLSPKCKLNKPAWICQWTLPLNRVSSWHDGTLYSHLRRESKSVFHASTCVKLWTESNQCINDGFLSIDRKPSSAPNGLRTIEDAYAHSYSQRTVAGPGKIDN